MGKFQIMLIIMSGLSIMGALLENLNMSYVLPYVKCDLKLSIAEQGALTSVSFLGIVSTSYFWGFLIDTWGRQKVLCVAALCGFSCSFISSLSTHTFVLIAFRFLAGAWWVFNIFKGFSFYFECSTMNMNITLEWKCKPLN